MFDVSVIVEAKRMVDPVALTLVNCVQRDRKQSKTKEQQKQKQRSTHFSKVFVHAIWLHRYGMGDARIMSSHLLIGGVSLVRAANNVSMQDRVVRQEPRTLHHIHKFSTAKPGCSLRQDQFGACPNSLLFTGRAAQRDAARRERGWPRLHVC